MRCFRVWVTRGGIPGGYPTGGIPENNVMSLERALFCEHAPLLGVMGLQHERPTHIGLLMVSWGSQGGSGGYLGLAAEM